MEVTIPIPDLAGLLGWLHSLSKGERELLVAAIWFSVGLILAKLVYHFGYVPGSAQCTKHDTGAALMTMLLWPVAAPIVFFAVFFNWFITLGTKRKKHAKSAG